MIELSFRFALISCFLFVPRTSAQNLHDVLNDIYHTYKEGPGEGCFGVCLSKEIEKLHREIKAVTPTEISPIVIPRLDKVEETTNGNSAKLDELLEAVRNITAASGSSEVIESLKRQLEDAKATVVTLRDDKNQLLAEAVKANLQIHALEKTVKALEKSLAARTKECAESVDGLTKSVRDLRDEAAKHLGTIAELEAENDALKKQRNASEAIVEKLREDLAEEKRVADEALDRVEKTTANLAEEKAKLKGCEDRVEDLTEKLATEKTKTDADDKLIGELTKNLEEEEEEVRKSRKRVDESTAALAEAKVKLKEAAERAEKLKARLGEEMEKARRCDEALEKSAATLAESKAEAARCGGELRKTAKELGEAEEKAKRLGENLGACYDEIDRVSKDAEEAMKNMKKDLDELMRAKERLSTELEKCRRSEKESAKKIAQLESAVKAKQTQLDQLAKEKKDLKADNVKKTEENVKLNKDLKECIKNPTPGKELKKLQEENAELQEENAKLKEEIAILSEGQRSKPVDIATASYGASSNLPFCEADKAFTGDRYAPWTSSEDVPQTIWVQLKKAVRLTRFSFKCGVAPRNGASKFELVATNDPKCGQDSAWDVIYEDLSGKGFVNEEDTIVKQVDACKMYSCYGIRVLDVNNDQEKSVIMSEIKMWARD